MFSLKDFLRVYSKNEETFFDLLKDNLRQVDTDLLIKMTRTLNEELKVRIKEFEKRKAANR